MRRRDFVTLLGGAAAVWPLPTRAQHRPDKIRQIGMLMGFAQDDPVAQSMVAAFRGALSKLGWIEGSNVRIDGRVRISKGSTGWPKSWPGCGPT